MPKSPPLVPAAVRNAVRVYPLPKNMDPTHNADRRAARAKAVLEHHLNVPGTRFVDAAEYGDRRCFAAVVIDGKTGVTVNAASIVTRDAQRAEELAIALAIADPETTMVLSDSKSAVRNFAKGWLYCEAVRVLERVKIDGRKVTIKWFPAHAGNEVSKLATNHNETANAVARGLAGRAAAVESSAARWTETKDRYDTFQGITKYYRNCRRVLAPPHPDLTREEASTFRQLQTNSVMTPVVMKHIQPELYTDDTCVLCNNARASTAHLLWDCEVRPNEAATRTDLPPWIQEAVRSCDKDTQLSAVQQVLAALEKQHRSESCGATPSLMGQRRPTP